MTLDHRFFTEKGQKQIKEDLDRTKLLGEAFIDLATKDSVGVVTDANKGQTGLSEHIARKQNYYSAAKEFYNDANNSENKEILANPENYSPKQREEAMQSMIFYIAKTTGTKPSEVVLMLNDERKGFYSNENKKVYISDNANDNSKKTAQTVAHEASHMVDDQRYGNENKSDTYKNNREEYADLISQDFANTLDQEYADNGYDISKATHQNSNTQINSVTNKPNQVDKHLVRNTDKYNDIDRTKGESSIVVPIATEVRWLALKGKVSFMELKKQDIEQNIRIEELTAQKLAKQVNDAINIVQDIPEIVKNIPQTIKFLIENPEELKKLPPHVVKAVTQFTESFVESSKAIKDGSLTNDPIALEKQAQAESDLLANVASVFIGAGIANVSVKTGKVVVEKVSEATKKIAETSKNTSSKSTKSEIPKTSNRLFTIQKIELTFNTIKESLDNLDVKTTKDNAVFYSGRGARDAAENYAKNNAKTTLELTSGGKWLDDLKLYKSQVNDITELNANNLWSQISSNYAKNATGTVHAIINNPRSNSVFLTSELPILLKNNNVSKIVIKSMSGKKIEIAKNTKLDEAIKMIQGL